MALIPKFVPYLYPSFAIYSPCLYLSWRVTTNKIQYNLQNMVMQFDTISFKNKSILIITIFSLRIMKYESNIDANIYMESKWNNHRRPNIPNIPPTHLYTRFGRKYPNIRA